MAGRAATIMNLLALFRAAAPLGCLVLVSYGLAVAQTPATSAAAAPTLEELYQPLAVNEARLAPDGRHLAAITSAKDGTRSLLVIDLATQATEVVKAPADIDVGTVRWVDGTHLLFTDGYNGRYASSLFHGQLGRLGDATRFSAYELTNLVGLPRARTNRALAWVVVPTTSDDGYNQVVEYDVNVSATRRGTRTKSTVARTYSAPKGGIPVQWLAQENGELGYAETYADRKFTAHRLDAKGDWHKLDLDLDRAHLVAGDPDQHSLWISQFAEATGFVLQKYDTLTGAWSDPIWHDANYDLATARLHFSRKTGQLVALSYEQRRHFTKCFQEPFLSAQKAVQKRYPETNVHLLNFDDQEQKLLFRVSSPQDPGRIVLLDLERNSLEVMSEVAPWMQGKALQPTFPMSYKTADGLREEGYLTLPAGASAAHKVPLVVLVHSGPARRDEWDFDAHVQWLASRGYAVLQPNYRGSSGYQPNVSFNERFAFARMPGDVVAATHAGAALEMIDASRVAVMGENFGGFLALAAASTEPGLYRCAISVGGTFDWDGFIRELSYYPTTRGDYEILRDFVGKPGKDRDAFDAMSPLKHADTILAAVFLAYSENPNLTSHAQSRELASLLGRRRGDCETFVLKSNWYDLRAQASWLELMHKLDTFLAARLPESAPK